MLKGSLSNLNQRNVRDRLLPESYDYTNTNILSKTNLKISTARSQIPTKALKGYFKKKTSLESNILCLNQDKTISLANMNKNLPERKKISRVWSNFFFYPPLTTKKRFPHFPSQRRWIQASHVNVTADVILPQLEHFCSRQSFSQTLLEKHR